MKHQVTYPQVAGTWEIFSIFMKADRHHTISSVESLLNPITMMTVDVNV